MIRWRKNIVWSRLVCYLLPLICVLLIGCRPKGVLSSRELRKVLIDLHKADAVLQVAGYNYGHDEAVAKYYQAVLDKHGITQAQFDSTLVWYTDNPQLFDKIYPKVIAALEAEQDALRERITEEVIEKQEPRDLPDLEQIKQIYYHGLQPYWPNMWENEEKCKKSDEKFAYVIEIS